MGICPRPAARPPCRPVQPKGWYLLSAIAASVYISLQSQLLPLTAGTPEETPSSDYRCGCQVPASSPSTTFPATTRITFLSPLTNHTPFCRVYTYVAMTARLTWLSCLVFEVSNSKAKFTHQFRVGGKLIHSPTSILIIFSVLWYTLVYIHYFQTKALLF